MNASHSELTLKIQPVNVESIAAGQFAALSVVAQYAVLGVVTRVRYAVGRIQTSETKGKDAMSNKSMKRIHKVTVRRMADESPDTSHYGEYGNTRISEFSIDRKHSLDCVLNSQGDTDNEPLTDCAACEHLEIEHVDGKCIHGATSRNTCGCLGYSPKALECSCGGRGDMQRNEYRYFKLRRFAKDNLQDGLTPEQVRKYVRDDYGRMERLNNGEWGHIGIRAEAEVGFVTESPDYHTQTITSGGCWGIEDDCNSDHEDIEQEELAELRAQLRAIGFS